MKSTFSLQEQFTKLMSSSDKIPDRGSGRILGIAIALLLLIPGVAFAGARDEFPGNRCPGSGCPDNAQPQ